MDGKLLNGSEFRNAPILAAILDFSKGRKSGHVTHQFYVVFRAKSRSKNRQFQFRYDWVFMSV